MFKEGRPNPKFKRITEKYNNIEFSNSNYHPELYDRRKKVFGMFQKTSISKNLDDFVKRELNVRLRQNQRGGKK